MWEGEDNMALQILDITASKHREITPLKQEIYNAVKDTQRVIIRELPNQLLMTREQFDLLQEEPEFQRMYESKDFLYYTPMNVMEVRVKQ